MSATSLPIYDFPERLGAITVRELRSGLLGRDFVYLLIGVQLALAFCGIYAVEISPIDAQNANGLMQAAVWAAAIIGLGLLFPLRALRALNSDRESGLLHLLQLTPLSSGRIVGGKFASLAIQSLLYLVTLLPFFALRYFLGGADLVSDGNMLVLMFGGSLLLQAFCFLLSTVGKVIRGLALAGLIVLILFWVMQVLFSFAMSSVAVSGQPNLGWLIFGFCSMQLLGVWLFLSVAAQSIAAPAENYVGRARLALLALLLGVAAMGFVSRVYRSGLRGDALTGLFTVVFIGLTVAALLDLTSEAKLLTAQIPRRLARSPFRLLVLALLPGWRSALVFHTLLIGAVYLAALCCEVHWRLLVLVPHGFVLLLLPRLLLQTVGRNWPHRGPLVHLLCHLVFGIPAALLAAFFALRRDTPEWPSWLPITGFWNGLAWAREDARWSELAGMGWAVLVFAGVLLIALPGLGLAFYQTQRRSDP